MTKALLKGRAYFYGYFQKKVCKEEMKLLKIWKENCKKILQSGKSKIAYALAVGYVVLAYGNQAYAIGDSIYVNGTKKLLKDVLSAAQVIIGVGAFVLWLVWEGQKRVNEENEESRYSKRQKSMIVGVIIAETIMTFFNVIGSYYGISFN